MVCRFEKRAAVVVCIYMAAPDLKKNNVLVLEFDKYGILQKKEFYNKEKMKKIKFTKNITTNKIRTENFIYGFLSSIRQKMESKKK